MTNNFYEYKCYNCVWGLVHATPKEYENTALFLRLHLLSWNAFRSNLKTPALRFSVDKTQFQNCCLLFETNGVTIIVLFPWLKFRKTQNQHDRWWLRF